MGDRGSIGFRTRNGCVWLYTHHAGSVLPELVTIALRAAQPRWDDPPYATRMALTTLIGDVVGESGWGVDTEPQGDLEHDALVIDWDGRRVIRLEEGLVNDWGRMNTADRRAAFEYSDAVAFGEFLHDPVTTAWIRWRPGRGTTLQ